MLTRVPFLGLVLVCLALNLKFALAEDSASRIILDFQHGKTLTAEEVKIVSALARKAGIDEIGTISTIPMHPSGNYLISVQEKPTEEGVFLRYKELLIGSDKFFSPRHQKRGKERSRAHGNAIKDGFWEIATRHVKYFQFEAKGEEFRVTVSGSVKHEDLMLIIYAIKNRRVEFSYDQLQKDLSGRNWEWPNHISLSTKETPELEPSDFVLHYRNGGSSTFFHVLLMGDTLLITGYGSSVS